MIYFTGSGAPCNAEQVFRVETVRRMETVTVQAHEKELLAEFISDIRNMPDEEYQGILDALRNYS